MRAGATARIARIAVLAALLMLVMVEEAAGHERPSFLDPAAGLILSEAPDRARVFFREPVTEGSLEVYGAGGKRVDEGGAEIGPPEPGLGIEAATVLSASLVEDLPEGVYEVRYCATGEDGHPAGETYRFALAGPDGVLPDGVSAPTSEFEVWDCSSGRGTDAQPRPVRAGYGGIAVYASPILLFVGVAVTLVLVRRGRV